MPLLLYGMPWVCNSVAAEREARKKPCASSALAKNVKHVILRKTHLRSFLIRHMGPYPCFTKAHSLDNDHLQFKS
jgi:hypothetical protein